MAPALSGLDRLPIPGFLKQTRSRSCFPPPTDSSSFRKLRAESLRILRNSVSEAVPDHLCLLLARYGTSWHRLRTMALLNQKFLIHMIGSRLKFVKDTKRHDMGTRKRKDDNFESILQVDLPSGRKGKHHSLLLQVLEDLDELQDGRAIRIPLSVCGGSVADIRAAIFRATNKRDLEIATSSDDEFFYVWKPAPRSGSE